MVIHQAVGVTNPSKPANHLGQHAQKEMTVFVVAIDILLRIATGGDTVSAPGNSSRRGRAMGRV